MKDVTGTFGHLYLPVKALLLLQRTGGEPQDFYVESYDMDAEGYPVNGHPLSVTEASRLARALQVSKRKAQGFLTPKGLMPANVLTLSSGSSGFALWYTPPQSVPLLFTESLGIPSGEARLPALVWKAGKSSLQVFAATGTDFKEDTPLHHAPFFNVYPDGRVCMGTVNIRIPLNCGLEQFMTLWQSYFFGSYFSHLFGGHQPVRGNIIQLWQHLNRTGEPFPDDQLIPNQMTLKNLLP